MTPREVYNQLVNKLIREEEIDRTGLEVEGYDPEKWSITVTVPIDRFQVFINIVRVITTKYKIAKTENGNYYLVNLLDIEL